MTQAIDPDLTGLKYSTITGRYMIAIEDSSLDPDKNPDSYLPNGTVNCTPVLPPSGAFRRNAPTGSQVVIPKKIPGKIKNGIICDEFESPGITLLSQVEDVAVYWKIDVTIKDNEGWVLYDSTYNINEWPTSGGIHVPDLVSGAGALMPELAAIQSAQAARDEIVRLLAELQDFDSQFNSQIAQWQEEVADTTYALKGEVSGSGIFFDTDGTPYFDPDAMGGEAIRIDSDGTPYIQIGA